MKLKKERIDVESLTREQKEKMFRLMDQYYVNTDRSKFDQDLAEKDCALVFFEEDSNNLVGFSTQKTLKLDFKGEPKGVLFSGDTIIAQEHWGSMSLTLAFWELMVDLYKELPDRQLWWMLISKGLRTYKYLPNCFNEYYPNWQKETPECVSQFMQELGRLKFPETYDSETGVIRSRNSRQYLKEQFHPIPNPKRPHEIFFTQTNPGYVNGDELLCLAELRLDNINPSLLEILNNGK